MIGLAIAAVVATCNATSSAQLAAVYRQSGGTYVYGWERGVAETAVALVTVVNYQGITRTTRSATVVVVIVLVSLSHWSLSPR